MASRKYSVHLDLSGNELQNAKLVKPEVDSVKFTPTGTAPATPVNGQQYYDSTFECNMIYDGTRAKWLSSTILSIDVGRTGNIAAGSSFRTTPDTPTSVTPIFVERDLCIVGVVASTSALEQFVIRVDDVSGGSGQTLAINYQAAGPTTTQAFKDLALNSNFNANDKLDVYVLSSASGTISDPKIRLLFRYRK